jgi:alkyl sulfatase BDS1-like metallo-beta-lactamase superfamily hydrolase
MRAMSRSGPNKEDVMAIKRRDFIKGCAGVVAITALELNRNEVGRALAATLPASARGNVTPRFVPAQGLAPAPPRPATPITRTLNEAVLSQLPFHDRADYARAARGLIAPLPNGGFIANPARPQIPVWNLPAYGFLAQDPAPPEANPSLWRQAQLNMNNGLFEVVPGIYQVRGADLSNMTIIEGKKGIIVIDPLVTVEAARTALDLYREQRGPRPVVAVIYTHSHVDHFGGVRGVVDEADVRARKVAIIAPERFLEKAISENVFAGTAMSRRSQYSYGIVLPRGIHGQIDAGLGKATSIGTFSLIPPTDTITRTGERRKIDGVEIIFLLAPDTEAPAEMMMYYPQFRALNAAELACALLHNIYTPRGAEVRDASKWAWYLDEALVMFGARSDVIFAQHNWPTWGNEAVITFLKHQRDLYKYLHDQTLHLANQGLTMNEIAEELARNRRLPASLDQQWYSRGHYGTVSHNVKAVYQKYLGWYDCNPAHLEPLPPEEAGRRYVEFMGGAANVIAQARAAFDRGEYRWVAEVMSHVVFAEPGNLEARNLAADALEQLGYLAESAIWRNHYLMGAYELRNGRLDIGGSDSPNEDAVRSLPMGLLFDFMGIRLNAQRAEGRHIVLNWIFTDTGESYRLNLENCALTYRPNALDPAPDASLTLSRATLDSINLATNAQQALVSAIQSGAIRVTGNPQKIGELFALLDTFNTRFNIIEP